MTDLILIDKLDPAVIFSDEEANKIIEQITNKVNEFDLDITTAKGRKEVSTLAAKVAKSKVLIDDLGKNLVSGWKADAKKVDIVRKKIRDELDDLKLRTRAPLTNWESDEKARIRRHEEGIAKFVNSTMFDSLEDAKQKLNSISDIAIDKTWEEFEHDATVAKFEAVSTLEKEIKKLEEQAAKDAELEKFRKQAAEDDKKRFEANQKAEIEKEARERLIKENSEKEANLARQQKAAETAQEEAKQAIKDAEDRAFREVEEKQAKEKAEADAREADTAHRGRVNREAVKALVSLGISKQDATTSIKAIASKMIPNVKIEY